MVVSQSIKSYKEIENIESENEFINRRFGRPAASKKRWDICKTFFQTLYAIFSYKRVFFTNIQKTNIIAFTKTICLVPILSVKNTLFTFFFLFSLFACIDFVKLFHLPIFEELRKLHAKKFMFSVKIGREIIFQSRQLYDLFFTQCYNFAIVQCILLDFKNHNESSCAFHFFGATSCLLFYSSGASTRWNVMCSEKGFSCWYST